MLLRAPKSRGIKSRGRRVVASPQAHRGVDVRKTPGPSRGLSASRATLRPTFACDSHGSICKRYYQSRAAVNPESSSLASAAADPILQFLTQKGMNYKFADTGPGSIRIRVCPFCPDTKGSADNIYKLYVYRNTSQYHCFRCGKHGSWFVIYLFFSHSIK